jgi:hypothetical protein
MRTTLLSSLLILAAATPALGKAPHLDVGALPVQCRWTGDAQAKGQPTPQRLAGITSAASCMAIVNLSKLSIEPTPEGARAVDRAIEPSLALLDSVIRSDDLESRLIATQAKGNLLAGAAVKMASSARPVGTMRGNDLATFNSHVGHANSLAMPFRERSAVAYRQLASLSQTGEARQLAIHNPVVATVVTDARIAPAQVSVR